MDGSMLAACVIGAVAFITWCILEFGRDDID